MADFTLNRREFVAASALTATAAVLTGCSKTCALYTAPADAKKGKLVTDRKINVACIGIGGKGKVDAGAMKGENVIALCDVDDTMTEETRKLYPNAKYYTDYRQLLTELEDQIDAVTISTPDHMHYPIALMAIQMGKHVYVQKPLTHTIEEARKLRQAARIHDVKAQMGNQGHSNEGTRLCKEWIEAGVIGDVTRVDIWTNRPIWPQNCQLPTDTPPVPATLAWNLWLGVAPTRPYSPAYVPFKWRGWWDYGCGAIGDMGCHTMDAAFWALDLAKPDRVELVEIDGGTPWSPSSGAIVKFHFPARGKLPPCVMTWYEGNKKPPMPKELEAGRDLGIAGQLFYGTKGVLHAKGDYSESVRLIPESAMAEFKNKPAKTLPRVTRGDHYQNWLDAIRGKVWQACSNFDHAAPLSELGAIGNLAIRSGKSFNWNSRTMTASDPAANQYITKTYRSF